MDFLSVFSLVLLIAVGTILAYGLIIIHDIPYRIAKKRNHPHAEAIEAAGWVSLLLMHAIWPFLWIWAMLYNPAKGAAAGNTTGTACPGSSQSGEAADVLEQRVTDLERRLAKLEPPSASVSR